VSLTDFASPSLGAVLRTALDAVVVMRMDGTIAGWNDVAERSFGWTFEEARGRRMSEMIIPHQHRDAHEKGLAHFHATGEGPVLDRHVEISALTRDGREIPIELSITLARQFEEPVFLGFLRDISDRREAERRQALMVAELNHRVKNMLAVVAGIAHQTARSASSVEEFSSGFFGRLDALARGHELLTAGEWEGAELGELVQSLLGPYAEGEEPHASFSGPPVRLEPRQVLSLSMILHELLTNAAKYGALSKPEGRIAVEWSLEGKSQSGVRLVWTESGLSGIRPPRRNGFGLKMIGLSASHELGGTVEPEWREDGLSLLLHFPAGKES
jgi:PAS domain S-box-containing protein